MKEVLKNKNYFKCCLAFYGDWTVVVVSRKFKANSKIFRVVRPRMCVRLNRKGEIMYHEMTTAVERSL